MIVSDRYQFLIATPTKSGNTSLRRMAEEWVKGGGDPLVLSQLNPQHRMAVPPGREDYDRWLMVRDPYARLVSCFEFMRRIRSQWGYWQAQGGFERFVEWYARERAAMESRGFTDARVRSVVVPYVFMDSYRALHSIVAGHVPLAASRWGERPCGLLRVEDIDNELARVAAVANDRATPTAPARVRARGAWAFPAVRRINVTRPGQRLPGMTSWQDYWRGDRLGELGDQLCGPDRAWLAAREEEPGRAKGRSTPSRS